MLIILFLLFYNHTDTCKTKQVCKVEVKNKEIKKKEIDKKVELILMRMDTIKAVIYKSGTKSYIPQYRCCPNKSLKP